MRKIICFFLLSLFVFGCSGKPAPTQVKGNLKFGPYVITPPKGYWYFPSRYPKVFKSSKKKFLVTFWEDKEDTSRESYPKDRIGLFFNFGVTVNTYKNIEAYYDTGRASGITYKELPNEAKMLKSITNWSCKEQPVESGYYGIECISLRDNIITIGAYGGDKNAVLSKIQLLQKMLESFIMGNTGEIK